MAIEYPRGDFDLAGHSDIIWQEPVSGQTQVSYLGGAQGTSIVGAAGIVTSSSLRVAAIADLNGDGHPDIVWQDPNTGESQVWFMGGTLGTSFLGSAVITMANSWRIVASADFNLDGHPDLVWQDPTSGWAQIWYLGGSQGATVVGAANLTLRNSWHVVGASDFNGDGQPDLLWQDPASGTTQLWYLGGAQGNIVTNAVNLTGANSWHIVAVADFNLDGHPDVIWQNPVSGDSQAWFLGGSQGTTTLGTSPLNTPIQWNIVGPR
jgi:hypothetical protein